MQRNFQALVTILILLLATGGALAQEPDPVVMLEATNFPGHFIRHSNFEAVLTKVESLQDRKDAAFVQRPALNRRAGVSFESVNFPGRYLRHRDFRLVLEPNDGTAQFAADASFVTWQGPAGATGFEASNFAGHFVRHKNFMLYVEKTDDSEQFHADSGFMVRSVDNPVTGNDDVGRRCTITVDANVRAGPGRQWSISGYIAEGEVVMSNRRQDGWYRITGANIPNGPGWVSEEVIRCD